MRKITPILALLCSAAAFAAPRESASFTNVDSAIATNMGLVNIGFSGTYAPKFITISGTLEAIAPGTYAKEAVIQVYAPNGQSFVIQPAQDLSFTSLTVAPTMFAIPVPISSAAGIWSFRCVETFDDGVIGTADARWATLNVQLNDGPPTSRDLGAISTLGVTLGAGPLPSADVRWFRFSLDAPASIATTTFLDIDTLNSIGDTEIALYNDHGALITSDDDDGPALTSQLTFGVGGRPSAGGNGLPYDGRDGQLTPGTYYLALTSFDAVFSNDWGLTPGTSTLADARLRIRSNTGPAECPADLDDGSGSGAPDGGVTIDDLLYFLQRFEGGC